MKQIGDWPYKVTEDGRVWSDRSEQFLTPGTKDDGYKVVVLCLDGNRKTCRVSRLVAEAFIPNPENKPEVNHKDGNKEDNSVDNLEWMTPKENTEHSRTVLGNKMGPQQEWLVESPEGHQTTITNLNEFCRNNGLSMSSLSGRGKTQGWRAIKLDKDE